jgi:hypothetical protein
MTKKVTLSRAKKILRIVPASKSFWLCTNEYLRSLNTLALSLESATDDVFRYHVDKYKNDFSTWVKDIVDDKDLAREISRIKTRYTLVRKIRENVDESKNLVKRYKKHTVKKKARPRPRRIMKKRIVKKKIANKRAARPGTKR